MTMPYNPDPRFATYSTGVGGPGVPGGYDPHAALVAQLTAERDGLAAELRKAKRGLRRANIAGGIVLAFWIASFAYQFALVSA